MTARLAAVIIGADRDVNDIEPLLDDFRDTLGLDVAPAKTIWREIGAELATTGRALDV